MNTAQGVDTDKSEDERDEQHRPITDDRVPGTAVPVRAKVSTTIMRMLRNILEGSTWDEQAVICNVMGEAYIKDVSRWRS